jgi:hypothetical protein
MVNYQHTASDSSDGIYQLLFPPVLLFAGFIVWDLYNCLHNFLIRLFEIPNL